MVRIISQFVQKCGKDTFIKSVFSYGGIQVIINHAAFSKALAEQLGEEEQVRIFRKAGFKAGAYFAENILDISLPLNAFIASLQSKMEEMKIGVLRIEKFDEETGRIMLTVSEDADCSGLPLLGETVCNYDEGFIAGILSSYTGKEYSAVEVDCWATGDRVCRFRVEPEEKR